MDPLALSEDHELQLQSLLRFTKSKRDQHVRETIEVIQGFKDDRLSAGEMYNYQELVGMFKDLESEVQQLVDKEIQHAYHTSALMVKVLLSQAQNAGLQLKIDTNQLENESWLRGIASSEVAALSNKAPLRSIQQPTKLVNINISTQQDLATAQQQKQQLEQEMKTLQERLAKFQEQTTQTLRDRTAMTDELNKLRDELASKDALIKASQGGDSAKLAKLQNDFQSLSMDAAGAASSSEAQFKELQRQMTEQRQQLQETRINLADSQKNVALQKGEIQELKDLLASRIQEAPQFKQMRSIMEAKSKEAADLRTRLQKYEPQQVPSADR